LSLPSRCACPATSAPSSPTQLLCSQDFARNPFLFIDLAGTPQPHPNRFIGLGESCDFFSGAFHVEVTEELAAQGGRSAALSGDFSAGVPARKAAKPVAQREANAEPRAAHQNAAQERATTEPAAERRKNTAHGASRGTEPANNPAPKERKTPDRDSSGEDAQEYGRIQQAQAAIAGALKGNWRDLRTVFDFAGISEPNKEAPS
jgi:hypothetical protein